MTIQTLFNMLSDHMKAGHSHWPVLLDITLDYEVSELNRYRKCAIEHVCTDEDHLELWGTLDDNPSD